MAQAKKKPVPMKSKRSGKKKMILIKKNHKILKRLKDELK